MALNPIDSERTARTIALGVPLALLGGAYVSQYGFGLYPCEMCWWQRWALFAALPFGLIGWFKPSLKLATALALLSILTGGLIGGFHAGVEYGWWEGLTACATTAIGAGGDPLDSIMNAPVIRCDVAPWDLFGISLAGWNFLISVPLALLGLVRLRGKGA